MHLKTALSNIRRTPFQALAAITVLSVTFFVASVIAILIYGSNQVLNYFETRPQVIAFIKNDAKDPDIKALEDKLKGDQRIKDVKFVSKEDALAIYKNATSDNPLLGELVSPSIFPSSIEFSVADLSKTEGIINDIKKESVVDSVGFTASLGNEATQKEVVGKLTKITFYIRVGGIVLGSVLAFTSFLVLMIVISMRIVSRKGEIETLKLIGATSGFIKGPILIEAIIYVSAGVFFGWLLSLILILYATPALTSYFAQIAVVPKETSAFIILNLVILGSEFLIGLVIAIAGGLTAVSRSTSK